ncbi:MAG: hypothetical protein ACKO3O_12340, partial [Gammaproteobacteria bacterium]
RVAGATQEIFTPAALRELHRQGRGLPRLVNVIADRAMLAAFASDRHEIKPAIVRAAAAEVAGTAPRARLWIWLAIVATALAIAGTALVWLR